MQYKQTNTKKELFEADQSVRNPAQIVLEKFYYVIYIQLLSSGSFKCACILYTSLIYPIKCKNIKYSSFDITLLSPVYGRAHLKAQHI